MATTVTSKGQVTIPKKVREHLAITPGSAVEFVMVDGLVTVVKAGESSGVRDRFERVRGTLKCGMTTDEIMRLTRGED